MFTLAVENLICDKRIDTCSFIITVNLGHNSDIVNHFANNFLLKTKRLTNQENIHYLQGK
jgi:hypothetical protein